MRSIGRFAAASLLATVLLVACDRGDGGTPSSPSTGPTPTATPTATTTPSATPIESPSPEPSPTEAALPEPVEMIMHGGTYFGVYLAAAPMDDPLLDEAVAQLAALGITAYPGDLACDDGATEQLGVSEGLMGVAVYFEHRAEARVYAAALDPSPLGIAKVTTYCAD